MSIIPLKQTVKIHKPDKKDEWGYVKTHGQVLELPARVDEKTEKVVNEAGDEVLISMEIYLNGLADVQYRDEIEFEDELERVTRRKPVKIEPVRMINGKATLTVVKL